MRGYLGIRFRLFFLLVIFLLSVLAVQSFVLLSLTRHEEEKFAFSMVIKQQETKKSEHSFWLAEKYRQHWRLALAFLVVNSLVFAVILFFRIDKVFIRPLEKLSELGERYQDDDFVRAGFRLRMREPFYALAHTLRQMLERIDSDRERLQRQVTELEQVNSELVASRKQLVRSEKLATVGQLSAGLAHEIGNPLATISGYLDLLQLADLKEEERSEYAAISRSELERVGRLVRELLQFSRAERPDFEHIAAAQFFQECIELASMHEAVRKCEIALDIEQEDMLIYISPDNIRQVVLNLLLNAATSLCECQQESKKIIVSLGSAARSGEFTICVRDNGLGVSPEIEQRLFEPFFTTRESGKGTGLGLFVCQLLVERLGGEISAGNRTDGS
ncbi:MAG: hypothetical protein CSA20_10135, partial [Deltaproteobacteria bacterium]